MDTNLVILFLLSIYLLINICRNEYFSIMNLDIKEPISKRKNKYKKGKKIKEKFSNKEDEFKFLSDKKEDLLEDEFINMLKLTENIGFSNKFFQEKQYHSEYKDVITAIKYMTDSKKKFNLESLPVNFIEDDIESDENAYNLINLFMIKLNKYINENIIIPDEVKSGWDAVYKKLGIPILHDKTNTVKNKIEVIKILNIYKFDTNNQSKYVYDLILSKDNVIDKMILNVELVYNKSSKKDLIEKLFIKGFITNSEISYIPSNRLDYSTKEQENPNKVTDIEYIQKELYKKYKKQLCREKLINLNIDDRGKAYRVDLHEEIKNLKCD